MAVVQISKIQIRRGKEYQDGIPQLAGGEMAWAVDTQRLYIGNGAVSEGAPQVGNTRILTETDNLLDIAAHYIYKRYDSAIQTGDDVNYPIIRSLQDRLDDTVSAAAYGIFPVAEDQTEKIQRAIDNLFANISTKSSAESRITLEFGPGVYFISSTIYLPSHVRIVGAGSQKTIFQFTTVGTTCFQFVNDTSTPSARYTSLGITYNLQPKFCMLKGFTLNTGDPTNQALELYAVRDSYFEDLEITGGYGDSVVSANSIGLGLYARSSVVTCQRNYFKNVILDGFANAVFSKTDIINNVWDECNLINCRYGFNFGTGTSFVSGSGELFGPRRNVIQNSYFHNIDRQGVLITNGYGNKVLGSTFVNVGNDGGGNFNNQYAQISFVSSGNSLGNNSFDRAFSTKLDDDPLSPTFGTIIQDGLANTNLSETYLPEVDGVSAVEDSEARKISLQTSFSPVIAFRLPVNGATGFEISYVLTSSSPSQTRYGKITIGINYSSNTAQLTDDFDFTGSGTGTNIGFDCIKSGNSLTLYYYNFNITNTSFMTYTYKAIR